MRRLILTLHLSVGLIAGVFILLSGLTGAELARISNSDPALPCRAVTMTPLCGWILVVFVPPFSQKSGSHALSNSVRVKSRGWSACFYIVETKRTK